MQPFWNVLTIPYGNIENIEEITDYSVDQNSYYIQYVRIL